MVSKRLLGHIVDFLYHLPDTNVKSSTDRKFTVFCKLSISVLFFKTLSLGFTFVCKRNWNVLKKKKKHFKEHAAYIQTFLLDWTGHIWQMVTEESVKPVLVKEAVWLYLYDSFLARSLKTQLLDTEDLHWCEKQRWLMLSRYALLPESGDSSSAYARHAFWLHGQLSADSQERANKRSVKAADI